MNATSHRSRIPAVVTQGGGSTAVDLRRSTAVDPLMGGSSGRRPERRVARGGGGGSGAWRVAGDGRAESSDDLQGPGATCGVVAADDVDGFIFRAPTLADGRGVQRRRTAHTGPRRSWDTMPRRRTAQAGRDVGSADATGRGGAAAGARYTRYLEIHGISRDTRDISRYTGYLEIHEISRDTRDISRYTRCLEIHVISRDTRDISRYTRYIFWFMERRPVRTPQRCGPAAAEAGPYRRGRPCSRCRACSRCRPAAIAAAPRSPTLASRTTALLASRTAAPLASRTAALLASRLPLAPRGADPCAGAGFCVAYQELITQ